MNEQDNAKKSTENTEQPREIADAEAKDVVGGTSSGHWEDMPPVDRSSWPMGSGE